MQKNCDNAKNVKIKSKIDRSTFHLLLIGPIVHLLDRQLVNAIFPICICYTQTLLMGLEL